MRFEHILQVYWSKGFFYSGRLFYFNITFEALFNNLPGLNTYFKKKLISRFELTPLSLKGNFLLNDLPFSKNVSLLRPLNILFSQVNSVNNKIQDLLKLILIRNYLIKSYKGRCHAIGKPVRGQRTWSNAWSSFNNNKTLRFFIGETSKILNKNKVQEKINYKMVKKKYVTKKKKIKTVKEKKISWF